MKILISGGAGFIGSHLCDYYIAKNNEVWCIDNLLTGCLENISHLIKKDNFKFLNEDLILADIEKLPVDFNYIFHLASPASPPDYFNYPIKTLRVNSIGTEKLLLLSLKNNNTRFLFTSTSEVYGDPKIPVQNEEYWGNVNPVGVRSVYDEAKRYGEALVMAYHRKYKLNTRIVRIFNTYGPRMRINDGRVIPNFISQALSGEFLTVYGDGKQTRSFCYMDDLAGGLVKMMESDYHFPVNLGNPDEFTILELAEKIKKIIGVKTEMQFKPPLSDDPRRRNPDIRKAKEILNWSPKISLEEGLIETIEYFKAL